MDLTMTSQLCQVSQIYELESTICIHVESRGAKGGKILMVGNIQNLGKVIVKVPVRVGNSIL